MISSLIALLVFSPALSVPPANPIDALIDRHLAANDIAAAEICTDDEFLRRVTLDLAGRIPTLDELQKFRADPDRSAKIDDLLASPEFDRFMSEIWTSALVGHLDIFGTDREALRLWLEEQLQENQPWDEITRALITARGTASLDGPVNFLVRNRDDPVVKVGRMFLGVRLDCAQCHDHPFDRWTQDDYRQMRRFFGQVETRQQNGSYYVLDEIGRTGPEQRPVFLTGAKPQTDHWRGELALFVTNSKPFARTFANRVWYHLMGRGIVHPIDDFNALNPGSVPGLVDDLAERARADRFSLREMVRLICNSSAWQRDSRRVSPDAASQHAFAWRTMKPLTPGQYFDSVYQALELDYTAADRERFVRATIGDALQEDFNPTWEYRETVQMAMSRLATPFGSLDYGVTELYRRILSRDPTQRELQLCADKPAGDIVFALIHSNEFFFNH